MIQSAALLFREHGIAATSFADVIEHSGAPRGSIYHHFPGGKAQLAEEATRYAGQYIAAAITQAGEADPAAVIRHFVAFWRTALEASDFAAGCPVAAAALQGDQAPGARDAAGAAFAHWQELTAGMIERRGVSAKQARSMAALAVAAIEGAIVMARAQRSAQPLEQVGAALEALASGAPAETAE